MLKVKNMNSSETVRMVVWIRRGIDWFWTGRFLCRFSSTMMLSLRVIVLWVGSSLQSKLGHRMQVCVNFGTSMTSSLWPSFVPPTTPSIHYGASLYDAILLFRAYHFHDQILCGVEASKGHHHHHVVVVLVWWSHQGSSLSFSLSPFWRLLEVRKSNKRIIQYPPYLFVIPCGFIKIIPYLLGKKWTLELNYVWGREYFTMP